MQYYTSEFGKELNVALEAPRKKVAFYLSQGFSLDTTQKNDGDIVHLTWVRELGTISASEKITMAAILMPSVRLFIIA